MRLEEQLREAWKSLNALLKNIENENAEANPGLQFLSPSDDYHLFVST